MAPLVVLAISIVRIAHRSETPRHRSFLQFADARAVISAALLVAIGWIAVGAMELERLPPHWLLPSIQAVAAALLVFDVRALVVLTRAARAADRGRHRAPLRPVDREARVLDCGVGLHQLEQRARPADPYRATARVTAVFRGDPRETWEVLVLAIAIDLLCLTASLGVIRLWLP
jgi:hypothetical protein